MLVVCVSMIVMFVVVLRSSHDTYHLELRQDINRPLARQLASGEATLMQATGNTVELNAALARWTRINPQIAVHVLDLEGRILASSSQEGELKLRQVNVAPLKRLLTGSERLPIFGDDPLEPGHRKTFSVAPVPLAGVPTGYLYVVLRNEDHESAAARLQASYWLHQGIWLIACWSVLALLSGLLMVRFITRPLQRLTEAVDRFRGDDFSDESRLQAVPSASSRDEIGRLADTFKEMAARIVKQVRELKQNDTARRELFANISHDLRTPLASLLGYLETVAIKENLSEEERRKYCQIAIQEARHLTALVDNLLELAKLDAPEAASAREPFMLQELSQAVIRKFALAASEKGVTLAQHVPHAMPVVWADPALIERVLENLVDNALHHTPAGGTVCIDLLPDVKGVTVRVSDTGSGIAPEDLPRIFDRFYRGEKSRQVAANSAGLGLAITKRILELHDCSITVESYVGLGTRFSFTLPIADASKAPAAALLGRDVGLRRGPEPLSTAVAEPGGQRP